MSLRNTRVLNATLDGAVIEDVVMDGMKGGPDPLFLRGNAYKHVILRGRIAPIEIRGNVFPSLFLPEEYRRRMIRQWDEINAAYYELVDWAIDITDAEFASFSISGIPARLIRRDPATSAVVRRDKALESRWKDLEYRRGLFPVVISGLISEGYDDTVLIACRKSRRFRDDMEDLAMLRDEGIAE